MKRRLELAKQIGRPIFRTVSDRVSLSALNGGSLVKFSEKKTITSLRLHEDWLNCATKYALDEPSPAQGPWNHLL